MLEKNWKDMDGVEKTWEVVKVVGSVALLVLPFLMSGGRRLPQARPHFFRPKIFTPVGGRKGWKY